MKISVPTKLAHTPLFFSSLFHHSTGLQKLQCCGSTLRRRGDIRGVCARSKITWSLKKSDGDNNGVESIEMGLVRPAIEDYAEEAIEAVRAGKVIAVPTDTLYGFACDAWYSPRS